MIVDELVTLLTYKVNNSAEMRRFILAVDQARKKVNTFANQLRTQVSAKPMRAVQRATAGVRRGITAWGTALNSVARKYQLNTRYAELFRRKQNQVTRSTQRMANVMSTARMWIGAFAASIGAVNMVQLMDKSAGLDGLLNIAADAGNAANVRRQIYENVLKSGSSFEGGVNLFAAVARNKQELGMTDGSAVQLSDLVSKAIASSSQGAGTDSAVITQFSQALSSGVLRGDELNSILEGSAGLAKAIADGFGISVSQLREMGQQGKLSSKELAHGLLKNADSINEMYAKVPKQFSHALENLRTIVIEKIGKPLNAKLGLGDKFYKLTKKIADNFDVIARRLAAGGIAYGLMLAVKHAGALSGILRGMFKLSGKALLLYGIFLIIEDIMVWMQGGDSLIGDWLGSFAEVKKTLEDWLKPLTEFFGTLALSKDDIFKLVNLLIYVGTVLFLLYKGAMIVVAAFKVIGVALGVVFKLGGFIVAAFKTVFAVLATLTAPVWGWIAAIIAAIAAIYLVWRHWDTICDWFNAALAALGDWFTEVWDGVKQSASASADDILGIWNGVCDWFNAKIALIGDWFDNLGARITEAFAGAANKAKELWNIGKGVWDKAKGFLFGETGQTVVKGLRNGMPRTPLPSNRYSHQNNTQNIHQAINITTTDKNIPAKVGAAARDGARQNSFMPSVEASW